MRFTLLFVATVALSLTFVSCNKDVDNVPIYVDDGGYGDSEFTDRLKEKLVDYGFMVVEDKSAEYEIILEDFYSYSFTKRESAPKDDCTYYYYDVTVYEAGYLATLYKNASRVDSWDGDRDAQDNVVEASEQNKTYCTDYYVNDVVDPRDGFLSSGGKNVAKNIRNYVNDND